MENKAISKYYGWCKLEIFDRVLYIYIGIGWGGMGDDGSSAVTNICELGNKELTQWNLDHEAHEVRMWKYYSHMSEEDKEKYKYLEEKITKFLNLHELAINYESSRRELAEFIDKNPDFKDIQFTITQINLSTN